MYIVWALLGIILILWDMYQKNSCKLILACTFLFCAIIAYKYPNNWIYQLTALVIFSIISSLLIKKILNSEKTELKKLNGLTNYIGKTATVTKDIGKTLSIDGIGFVNYNNELYKAKSVNDKEIKVGQEVRIISKENTILNVETVK